MAQLPGTLSDPAVYAARPRVCDLGFLRELYAREDGSVGYRCPAEPLAAWRAKGGAVEQTEGQQCLCNGLLGNIGLESILPNGERDKALVTLGDDVDCVKRYCTPDAPDYSAETVVRTMLSGLS